MALIVLAWRLKPLTGPGEGARDPYSGALAATGLFSGPGLEEGVRVQREDTEPVRFALGRVGAARGESE